MTRFACAMCTGVSQPAELSAMMVRALYNAECGGEKALAAGPSTK
jgi:hypothetical protein